MPYTLSRLAPGSYDVLLDGVIVAGLVRSGTSTSATWTAELLVDVHPRRRPDCVRQVLQSGAAQQAG
jgi:hypothetical protein